MAAEIQVLEYLDSHVRSKDALGEYDKLELTLKQDEVSLLREVAQRSTDGFEMGLFSISSRNGKSRDVDVGVEDDAHDQRP